MKPACVGKPINFCSKEDTFHPVYVAGQWTEIIKLRNWCNFKLIEYGLERPKLETKNPLKCCTLKSASARDQVKDENKQIQKRDRNNWFLMKTWVFCAERWRKFIKLHEKKWCLENCKIENWIAMLGRKICSKTRKDFTFQWVDVADAGSREWSCCRLLAFFFAVCLIRIIVKIDYSIPPGFCERNGRHVSWTPGRLLAIAWRHRHSLVIHHSVRLALI